MDKNMRSESHAGGRTIQAFPDSQLSNGLRCLGLKQDRDVTAIGPGGTMKSQNLWAGAIKAVMHLAICPS